MELCLEKGVRFTGHATRIRTWASSLGSDRRKRMIWVLGNRLIRGCSLGCSIDRLGNRKPQSGSIR